MGRATSSRNNRRSKQSSDAARPIGRAQCVGPGLRGTEARASSAGAREVEPQLPSTTGRANWHALWRVCEPAVAAMNCQLVEIELTSDPHGAVLRVYVDLAEDDLEADVPASAAPTEGRRPALRRGISLADCERVSRHLSTVLDVEDPIDGAYRLEVSSPGIPRPIRRLRDFCRFRGRRARLELHQTSGGRRRFDGLLDGVSEDRVAIRVENESFCFPVDAIRRARLMDAEVSVAGNRR